jgi:hypothetical protein
VFAILLENFGRKANFGESCLRMDFDLRDAG